LTDRCYGRWAAGQPVGRHPRTAVVFALLFSIAEEDGMPWIFRPISWVLATVVVGAMTHAAAAACASAAGDPQRLIVIEKQDLVLAHTASIRDQKLDALAAALRAATGEGLFAEEYDAILEAAQDDPQLREKVIEHMVASQK